MKHLWAPWRRNYIHSLVGAGQSIQKETGCLFCKARHTKSDRKHWVLCRGKHSLIMLNRYPYTAGHLMIASYRHVARPNLLNKTELSELWEQVNRSLKRLDKSFHPDGYNVGMNIGRPAGAGIPGHMHIHVVPRWNGDTNFMPVVSSTKVISDSMESLYRELKSCF